MNLCLVCPLINWLAAIMLGGWLVEIFHWTQIQSGSFILKNLPKIRSEWEMGVWKTFIHSPFIYCCLQSDLLGQGSEDMSPLKYKVTYRTLGKPALEVRKNLFTLLRGRGPLWSSRPILSSSWAHKSTREHGMAMWNAASQVGPSSLPLCLGKLALVIHLKHYQDKSQQITEQREVHPSPHSNPSDFFGNLNAFPLAESCDIDLDGRWQQPSLDFLPAA